MKGYEGVGGSSDGDGRLANCAAEVSSLLRASTMKNAVKMKKLDAMRSFLTPSFRRRPGP
jgi:hypothetical protein